MCRKSVRYGKETGFGVQIQLYVLFSSSSIICCNTYLINHIYLYKDNSL
jgi:hypothetical protein